MAGSSFFHSSFYLLAFFFLKEKLFPALICRGDLVQQKRAEPSGSTLVVVCAQ
jgi:hypothetical protein